jgi:hypothetical protein
MVSKTYSIGKLILKLQALGYEVDAPTLKRLEDKGVIDFAERLVRGENREDRQYSDEDVYAIARDLEWFYGLRSSVEDTLRLKKARDLHEGLIRKLRSDNPEDVRSAELFISQNRKGLTELVLKELQDWEVAKRGDKRHLEMRKQALKQMNELIRSLRDKRNGFGLLKQKLWESVRTEVEETILQRVKENPGIRQSNLYGGYEEFTNWIAPMLADWERRKLVRREKDGRTYRIFLCESESTQAAG